MKKFLRIPFLPAATVLFGGAVLQAATLSSAGEGGPPPATSGSLPVWSGGALLWVEHNDSASPVIHTAGADGIELPPVVFTVPEADVVRIYRTARGREGQLALCGTLHNGQGRGGGFIAFVSPTASDARVIRIAPFVPYLIAMLPDGSVWVQGLEVNNGYTSRPWVDDSAGTLRHFDNTGKQLASYIPRSSLGDLDLAMNLNQLAASGDRAAWYSTHARAYFEVGPDGKTSRYEGPPIPPRGHALGLAITDSGVAVLSVSTGASGRGLLYALDRASGKWNHLDVPPGMDASALVLMYGGDGDRLALLVKDRPAIQFVALRP